MVDVSSPFIVDSTAENIGDAATRLRGGRLVAFPTETVYGLGANATDDTAVARIFEAKQRPAFNPLICHFDGLIAAETQVVFSDTARQLAQAFWPGSLTLVLPRRPDCAISRLASAGLETVAVRVPDHPTATALLKDADRPIAAPSANRSGRLSPTRATHVFETLAGADVMIVDGGPCRVGIESTVVAIHDDGGVTLLREGGIVASDIAAIVGDDLRQPQSTRNASNDVPEAPGMLAHHYATAIPLRMNAHDTADDEFLVGFGPLPADRTENAESLSPSGDLQEAAANLFAVLHAAEHSDCRAIAVSPVPNSGLGRAINDRLRRSAAASESRSRS